MSQRLSVAIVSACVSVASCSSTVPVPDVYVPARPAGQRTPMSAACDPVDPSRCLLPWPSNTFTVADPTTATGLRLAVSPMGIGPGDDPTSINRADGFSRLTPVLTMFPGSIDTSTLGDATLGAVRVIVEQPGPTLGQVVPVRFEVQTALEAAGSPASMLIAYPLVPLAPDTDYAVVVVDSVQTKDGAPLAPDRNAQVARGSASPATAYEGALYAYDAPVRAAMAAASVDPMHVVRMWDFTTRSLGEPTTDLLAMRQGELAAVDAKPSAVAVAIDSVTPMTTGPVAVVVLGRLTGVPSYLTAAGTLARAATGAPKATGVHDVPFRVAVPAGKGDYHVVMYGHGTGGDYTDTNFDTQITAAGACKVGMQFRGWTTSSIVGTFGSFTQILKATDVSTAGLTQSVADGMTIQHALAGIVGDMLAGAKIQGTTNPAAGRRPSLDVPVWAGGSLGGTMGFVYTAAEPAIRAAVLNVPGAAWTHFITYSTLFSVVELFAHENYPTVFDLYLGVATSQGDWDPIDGAAWADTTGANDPVLLEQESMGDPVLPNIGNEMVASASHATQVGVVLSPIDTLTASAVAKGHNGITQFRVPSTVTDPLAIHGFAAGTSPAGVAAQQQIVSFITSVWAGAPSIAVPPLCQTNVPAGSCDFSSQ